jgi:N-acyl-L-homoserine lactone synthetase
MEAALAARISRLQADFRVGLAKTREDFEELHRLRFDVFCSQRGILEGDNGTESDPYDSTSRHVMLRRPGGEMVGTVRLVLPTRNELGRSFPMQRVCDPAVLSQIPLETTGEISRFCLSRNRRDSGEHADAVLRLGLMRGILRASEEAGLTHWCAVMEKGLLRLLQLAAIWFEPKGPPIEYFGTRQPAVASIANVLIRGQRERRPIWDYVTSPDPDPLLVVNPVRSQETLEKIDEPLPEESPLCAVTAMGAIPVIARELPVFNPATFERTAAFLAPHLVASHLHTLAERSEGLLRGLSAMRASPVAEEALAATSHTLAGSAGFFGFERLAALAGRFDYVSRSDKAEMTIIVESLVATIKASLQEMRLCVPPATAIVADRLSESQHRTHVASA